MRRVRLRTVLICWAGLAGGLGMLMFVTNVWTLQEIMSGLLPNRPLDLGLVIVRLIGSLLGMAAAMALYFWSKEHVLYPIEHLKEGFHHLERGSLDVRLMSSGGLHELEEIATIANRMVERLKEKTDDLQRENTRSRNAYATMLSALEDTSALNEQLKARSAELTDSLSKLESAYRELKELKEVDRLKADFLSAVSHELRTPLNFITGFASVLDDEVAGSLSSEQHRYLSKILMGADQLIGLINDLLDYTRMEAGRFTIFPRPVRYEALIRAALDNLRQVASQKGLQIKEELDELPVVQADPDRVTQVLYNLLFNAVKFGTTINATQTA